MNTENKAETAKKIAIMQASLDGKVIQWRPKWPGGTVWFTLQPFENTNWNWEANDYRVRPEPRRFWINLYHCWNSAAFPTREEADENGRPERIECVETVEVL